MSATDINTWNAAPVVKASDLLHTYELNPGWDAGLCVALNAVCFLTLLLIFGTMYLVISQRAHHKYTNNMWASLLFAIAFFVFEIAYLGARLHDFHMHAFTSTLRASDLLFWFPPLLNILHAQYILASWAQVLASSEFFHRGLSWQWYRVITMVGMVVILAIATGIGIAFKNIPGLEVLPVYVLLFIIAAIIVRFLFVTQRVKRMIQHSRIPTEIKIATIHRFLAVGRDIALCFFVMLIYLIFSVKAAPLGDPAMYYTLMFLPGYVASVSAVAYFVPLRLLLKTPFVPELKLEVRASVANTTAEQTSDLA